MAKERKDKQLIFQRSPFSQMLSRSVVILCLTYVEKGVEPGTGVCAAGEEEVAMKGRAVDAIDWTMVRTEDKLDR